MDSRNLQSTARVDAKMTSKFENIGLKIFLILAMVFIIWKFNSLLLGALLIPLLFFGCLFGGGC